MDVSENRLKSLPQEIGRFMSLKKLNVSGNELEMLPHEIGNLTQLREFDASKNCLKGFPETINNMKELKSLDLSRNQIACLPKELSDLTKLESLIIKDNSSLEKLPPNLERLIYLTSLSIQGTKISQDEFDRFNRAWQAAKERHTCHVFLQQARSWAEIIDKQNGDLVNRWQTVFSPRQQSILNDWLKRLEKTLDFKNNPQEIARIAWQMLEAVADNQSPFSITFWDQVVANNAHCSDRSAMALNELYTSYVIHTHLANRPLQDQLNVIARTAKTLALRRNLTTLIHEKQKSTGQVIKESVEILLYYELQLQKKLDLLTAVKRIAHSLIGQTDWIDENQLVTRVKRFLYG